VSPWFKAFRVLRVLRPLRMIGNVPSLKLVIDATLVSMPSIMTVGRRRLTV
jgi:hypothetical protein